MSALGISSTVTGISNGEYVFKYIRFFKFLKCFKIWVALLFGRPSIIRSFLITDIYRDCIFRLLTNSLQITPDTLCPIANHNGRRSVVIQIWQRRYNLKIDMFMHYVQCLRGCKVSGVDLKWLDTVTSRNMWSPYTSVTKIMRYRTCVSVVDV